MSKSEWNVFGRRETNSHFKVKVLKAPNKRLTNKRSFAFIVKY